MKEQRLLFLLLLTTLSLSAQVKGVVLDSISGKPIAYVNIWVENENIGTTSEENGIFLLEIKEEKNIVFSALGYETKILKSSEIEKVNLYPKVYEMPEVVLEIPKNNEEIEVGNYESSGFRWHLNYNFSAIYFKPTEETEKHPYLKEIKFHTISKIKSSKIRIRIVECNSDLSIGKDIIDEEILVDIKKGNKKNIKDVSSLNIKIPEKGFYIVLEKLLIEENKYSFKVNYKNQSGQNNNYRTFTYQPNFAYLPSEDNNILYANNTLNWTKHDKVKIKNPKSYENLLMRKYHDKYLVPSLEITLTN
ncbi:MAG: hypothetical protein ACI924_001961 [Flavobacterium sp.]|jgi:hypothetical protein